MDLQDNKGPHSGQIAQGRSQLATLALLPLGRLPEDSLGAMDPSSLRHAATFCCRRLRCGLSKPCPRSQPMGSMPFIPHGQISDPCETPKHGTSAFSRRGCPPPSAAPAQDALSTRPLSTKRCSAHRDAQREHRRREEEGSCKWAAAERAGCASSATAPAAASPLRRPQPML